MADLQQEQGNPGAGFTLLEALIALSILAGAAASLTTLLATSRRAQAEAQTDFILASEARTFLARIGRDIPLEVGTKTGVSREGRRWAYSIRPFEETIQPDDKAQTLFEVRLRIQLREEALSPSFEVSTLKRAAK